MPVGSINRQPLQLERFVKHVSSIAKAHYLKDPRRSQDCGGLKVDQGDVQGRRDIVGATPTWSTGIFITWTFRNLRKGTSMLKELYEAIVSDAHMAMKPQLLAIPGGQVMVLAPGREPEIRDLDRNVHRDKVASVASLTDWCETYDQAELVVKVFNDLITVDASRDLAHENDQVGFKLCHSKAFADLLLWIERPRSNAAVVTALRTSLYGTYDDKYLPVFRRLDFTRRNDGSKSVSHTGESLGKSIEAKAQSASGEIPEVLTFNLFLFNNVICPSVDLRFAVDVDANAELIKLTPISDCIPVAFQVTKRAIVDDLQSKLPNALVLDCN